MRLLIYFLSAIVLVIAVWVFLSANFLDSDDLVENLERSDSSKEAPKGFKKYDSGIYKVSLFYPESWMPENLPGDFDDENPVKYSGESGFFSVDGLGSEKDSVDSVVQSLAAHRLEPYGSNPKVLKTRISGREAAFIFPSADQIDVFREEAVLIIPYTNPVEIEVLPGLLESYSFFALFANQSDIEKIGESLVFKDGR